MWRSITCPDVVPVGVVRGQLLVGPGLDKVHPGRHLELWADSAAGRLTGQCCDAVSPHSSRSSAVRPVPPMAGWNCVSAFDSSYEQNVHVKVHSICTPTDRNSPPPQPPPPKHRRRPAEGGGCRSAGNTPPPSPCMCPICPAMREHMIHAKPG